MTRDCIIAEGGTPGAEYGHAIGLPYRIDKEGNLKFHEEPIYVSRALNYMLSLDLSDLDDESEAEATEEAESAKTE